MTRAKTLWDDKVRALPNRPRERPSPYMYMDQRRFPKVQWLLKHRQLWNDWPEDVWRVRAKWAPLVREMKVARIVGPTTGTDSVCLWLCIAWARDIIDSQNIAESVYD